MNGDVAFRIQENYPNNKAYVKKLFYISLSVFRLLSDNEQDVSRKK